MQYRKDNRTTEQFAADIKECTSIESFLMKLYVKWLNENKVRNNIPYTHIDNGINNTGDLIREDNDVDTRADFVLKREGRPDRLIDIKFCRKDYNRFHLKINQIKSYIKNDVCIINFMGIMSPNRRFCIIPPMALQEHLNKKEIILFEPWGYKEVLRFLENEFEWYKI